MLTAAAEEMQMMRGWVSRLAIAGAVAITAPPSASAQPAPAPAESAWDGSGASAPAVHRSSKVALPAELAGFARGRLSSVGPDDVAAGYGRKDGTGVTEATVYLFRPGTLAEHRLKGSVAAFGALSPTAFLWSAGPFAIPGTTPLRAWKGVFKTGIGADTVMDYLYFVELGRWTVKVRATLSGVREAEQETRIDALVAALPWPQILAANGGCDGPACRAPPFESFRHHYFETRLAPLLTTRMTFDPRKESKLPVAARTQAAMFGKTDIRRSEEGELIYVAAIPNFFTYRLVALPAPVTELFTKGFGALSVDKPVYAVVLKDGPTGLMQRLFNGKPTAEAFGEAIGGLAFEEIKPMQPVSDYAKSLPD